MTAPVIEVNDLRTYFHTDDGIVKAVDDVSLTIEAGKTLGVVGESGSGKSVTSLSIMGLLASSAKIETGEIAFLGKELIGLPDAEMRKIRGGEISMIFQEPMTSLNPVFKVGDQVMEAILLHQDVTKSQARAMTIELFDEVGIPNAAERVDSYPHQMSGGQKQRVMIAMALSCNPKLLIADEPTTALDVTIQSQILEMLRELRDKRGMAILFITHDLGVIAEIADDVLVMFKGRIVEYGSILDIFTNSQHPYTAGLLACRPRLDTPYKRLPTVTDFMSVSASGEISAKTLDAKRLAELTSQGRGRILHPTAQLESLGYPAQAVADASWSKGSSVLGATEKPVLSVRDLKVHFPVRRGLFQRVVSHVKAVDGVSFDVYKGQTLGLVGESGCGKTTTGRAILRLTPITAGTVQFQDLQVSHLDARELQQIRKRMQIIFQDPYGSLNPRMTIESALLEPMWLHGIGTSRSDRRDRAAALLDEVGLESAHLRRYPHEFSGGQRQRICIARALTVEPEFLICDESVSALDVSVQAQVLNLLNDLQSRRGLTYIFISHDLSVVKFMADMMAVMYDGKIIEFGPSEAIYADPQQEYTRQLISATPRDDIESIESRIAQREAARKLRADVAPA